MSVPVPIASMESLMACGTVEERDLDEAGSGISGLDIRKKRADLRPGPVRADNQVGPDPRPIREGDRVPAAVGRDGRDLAVPSDCSLRERCEKHVPKLAPVHLRPGGGGGVAGLVEQDTAILADDPLGVLAGARKRLERIEQVRVL